MPAGGDDRDVCRVEAPCGLRHSDRVLHGASSGHIIDQSGVRAVPGGPHQLRFAAAVPATSPAREQDGVRVRRKCLGVLHSFGAHLVERCASTPRVPQYRHEVHAQPRRRQPTTASNVATMVNTTMTAFLPWSFDSPLARGRMSTGTSSTRIPASCSRSSACTSGASLV